MKILEGAEVYVPVKGSRKNSTTKTVLIDTTDILFVCGGAFVGLVPDTHTKKSNKVGFGSVQKAQMKEHKIDQKALVHYGIIEAVIEDPTKEPIFTYKERRERRGVIF